MASQLCTRRQFLQSLTAAGGAVLAVPQLAVGEGGPDVADDEMLVAAHYYPWYVPGAWAEGGHIHTPLLGEYSSQSEEVINQHIDWARDYGIDAFVVSWNGSDDWTDRNIRANILEADRIGDIQFFLTYDQGAWPHSIDDVDLDRQADREKIFSDFEYFNRTFFEHPQYLEVNGKKPVFLYLSRVFGGDIREALSTIRDICASSNNDILLIGDQVYWQTRDERDEDFWNAISAYDAISTYSMAINNASVMQPDRFLHEVQQRFLNFRLHANQQNIGFIPNVMPGYNDNAKYGGSGGYPDLPRDREFFRRYCRIAKQNMDGDLNMVFTTSFNEWHEDTQVEPAEEYGFDYLEVVRESLAGDP